MLFRITILILLINFKLLSSYAQINNEEIQIQCPYTILKRGNYKYIEQGNYLIEYTWDYEDFWFTVFEPDIQLPGIDFNRYIVFALSSGCRDLYIENVFETKDKMVICVVKGKPIAEGRIPVEKCVLVKLKKTFKPVEIIENYYNPDKRRYKYYVKYESNPPMYRSHYMPVIEPEDPFYPRPIQME